MKRSIALIAILIAVAIPFLMAYACSSEPIEPGKAIEAESSEEREAAYHAGYWLDGSWIPLAEPSREYASFANTLAFSGKDLYIGGACFKGGTEFIPGYWKNASWIALPCDKNLRSGPILSIAILGEDVYASGLVENEKGEAIPGYWKNGKWIALSDPKSPDLKAPDLKSHDRSYLCAKLSVRNGKILLAGLSRDSGGNQVGYWIDGSWSPALMSGIEPMELGDYLTANSIDFFAGVYRDPKGDGARAYPGLWIGANKARGDFFKFPTLPSSPSSTVTSLAFWNLNTIYASGTCASEEGRALPVYWVYDDLLKKATLITLPSLSSRYDSRANSIAFFKGSVYIGGFCRDDSNIAIPGYWENGKWKALSRAQEPGSVSSIAVKYEKLYAVGGKRY